MPSSKNQNYLHGAAILTVAVVIVKFLGALYKIPMGNILDDEGFAHFNVAYNLYAVLLSLSTAGLPIALARLISEANSLNRPRQVKRIFNIGLVAFIVFGALGSLAMLVYPTELAAFMNDVKASQSMFILAPSVILVCVMSAFRGYTQGLSDMRPTAVSQVIEVAVKVAFGIGILLIMQNHGYSSPMMSAGAISGVAVGSLVACVYIAVVAVRRMRFERERLSDSTQVNDHVDSRGKTLTNLLKVCIPILLGSCILNVITLINTKLILGQLQNAAGFAEDQSLILFGVYSKALTLYNLPSSIIIPMTVSIVPAIAGFFALKNYKEAKKVTESSLRIATIIALPMAIGISVLATPIMNVLYHGSSEAGGGLLAIMGIASFFVCMQLITTSILQASGRERMPMITILIGGVLNIAINWYLVAQPNINIYGAPLGTLISYVIMCALNLIFIMTKLPEKPSLGKVFLRPVINSAIMGGVAWLLYPAVLRILGASLEPGYMQTLIALVASVGVAAVVYLIMTIITRTVTMEDMQLIPKGEKLAKLLRIKESSSSWKLWSTSSKREK